MRHVSHGLEETTDWIEPRSFLESFSLIAIQTNNETSVHIFHSKCSQRKLICCRWRYRCLLESCTVTMVRRNLMLEVSLYPSIRVISYLVRKTADSLLCRTRSWNSFGAASKFYHFQERLFCIRNHSPIGSWLRHFMGDDKYMYTLFRYLETFSLYKTFPTYFCNKSFVFLSSMVI